MASFDVIEELGSSGTGTIVIPDEDMSITMITIVYDSGSGILVKIGTAAGLRDIVYGLSPTPLYKTKVSASHIDCPGGKTLYYTITGASPQVDIFVQTIKNRQ